MSGSLAAKFPNMFEASHYLLLGPVQVGLSELFVLRTAACEGIILGGFITANNPLHIRGRNLIFLLFK